MNFDERNCLSLLKIEHGDSMEKVRTRLSEVDSSEDLGVLAIYLGAMLAFGFVYSFVYDLVRERSIGWVAGLTYGITHLQTGVIALMIFVEGIRTIRRFRYNGKVRKLRNKILYSKKAGADVDQAFLSAKHRNWDLPLTPGTDHSKQIDRLRKKQPCEFVEWPWTYAFFSFLYYPLGIGWTITGSLALSNVFSVHDHFANWVVVLGVVIACGAAVFFVHWTREEYDDEIALVLRGALTYLVGPLTFVVYMLIATVILLIGMAVSWFLSALPVIIVIAVIVLWIKNA